MVWEQIDEQKLSPMMQHYVSIKKQHPDCLILYRLGDFYEMFFDDAIVGSRILELALTGRDCGLEERAPMCGVPHHVIDSYAAKLVAKGYKVAIVEQMEDPKEAVGLVKRAITRIITPGTLTDGENLNQKKNNYLVAVYSSTYRTGLCYCDLSTGELEAMEFDRGRGPQNLLDRLEAIHPSELLWLSPERIPDELSQFGVFVTRLEPEEGELKAFEDTVDRYLGPRERRKLQSHFQALLATAYLLDYVYAYQEEPLVHINRLQWVDEYRYMQLNASTRENLELSYNLLDHSAKDSLLAVMDRAQTAMGSRLIAQWLSHPLMDREEINHRLDMTEYFYLHLPERMKVRESLGKVYDLERLLSKFAYGRGNARDLLSFSFSLRPLPELIQKLKATKDPVVTAFVDRLDPLTDLASLIQAAIVEDPPIVITEGGMIREGYSKELDRVRAGSSRAQRELVRYEEAERDRTGIKNLRVVFRKNVGYFIEITKSNLDKVPRDYRRKQTLKNAERFSTDKLEQEAARITGDSQRIEQMEYELFQDIRNQLAKNAGRIQETAKELAYLDALVCFGQNASDFQYVRPCFIERDPIEIIQGRHPVVEGRMSSPFIDNDLHIGEENNRIQIITGPNMAGKSTYMRQNALIIIMAQMGSFVPCKSCKLPLIDKIFTRIGATDHLSRGESTFMVEMKEMAEILDEASENSFLILDEVGRGTSTDDGLSIAYALLEYLAKRVKAKTLFATHYHELTSLENKWPSIANRKVDIQEKDGKLLFLHKVVEGKADKSYGIEVARLSGLPKEVLDRAQFLLDHLSKETKTPALDRLPDQAEPQPNFQDFQRDRILRELSELEINRLSPMEALLRLNEFQTEAQKWREEENDH